MMNQSSTRLASSLLLVISMIVLMVTVATAFMTTMSRQRGTAVLLAARTRAEIGMEHATAKHIKLLLEDYRDTSSKYSKASGSSGSRWYVDSLAIGDPDGDPWTEDGTPLGSGYRDTNNMVNIGNSVNLADMMNRSSGDSRNEYYGMSSEISRWHNIEFYDDFFQPIEIDPSLPEAQKALLRKRARYVLRYSHKTMDCDAQLTVNNNYPGAPILYNSASPDDYNRYQSYLRHFGRSIKSMTAMISNLDGRQMRSDDGDFSDTKDQFDYEELSIWADGLPMDWDGDASHRRMVNLLDDLRLRRESAFRMDPRTWVENTNGLDTKTPHMKGSNRITTWHSIGRHHGGTGMNGAYYHPHFQFTPYGASMLGTPLGGTDECTVPWRVNMLTCNYRALASIYGGLSSHIKHASSGVPYLADHASKSSWWSSGAGANADLFGPGYPEPFPLGFEDGKDIHLIGDINKSVLAGTTWPDYDNGYLANKQPFFGGGLSVDDKGVAAYKNGTWMYYPAYAHSYWADVFQAFDLTRRRIISAWESPRNLYTNHQRNSEEYFFVMQNPETGANYSGGHEPSWIDPATDDPDTMMNQIIMETCRILGEGYISPHSGATPAQSWNRYDNSALSLLGGGEALVGLNMRWDWKDRPAKRCKLSLQANTRAMEFVLNDCLISLYGKANPHYNPASDNLRDIAVDFNGDGYAESTVTGWYNTATNARVWSWWWNGLGPEAFPANGDWMKQGTWIRFYQNGDIERKRGGSWIALSGAEKTEFLSVNNFLLNGNWVSDGSSPVRPFSYTGRLFIGKSKKFQVFMRTEVLNIPKRKVMAATNRTFVYNIDPNNDGDFEDSHIASQQEFELQTTDL